MLESVPEKPANEVAAGADPAENAENGGEVPENNNKEEEGNSKEALTQEIEQMGAEIEKLGQKEDGEKIQDLYQLMEISDQRKVTSK